MVAWVKVLTWRVHPEPSVMEPRMKFLTWRVDLEPSAMKAKVKLLTWRVHPEPSVMEPRVKVLTWRVELEPSVMEAWVMLLTWRVELEPSVMEPRVKVLEIALVSILLMVFGFPAQQWNSFTLEYSRISVKGHATWEGVHHISTVEQCSWLMQLSEIHLFTKVYFTWHCKKIHTIPWHLRITHNKHSNIWLGGISIT
jgi:hypothetical protein